MGLGGISSKSMDGGIDASLLLQAEEPTPPYPVYPIQDYQDTPQSSLLDELRHWMSQTGVALVADDSGCAEAQPEPPADVIDATKLPEDRPTIWELPGFGLTVEPLKDVTPAQLEAWHPTHR
jgi:hypothetical protein